jgi:hypothetical protein
MAWWHHDVNDEYHLLESFDQGATWSQLLVGNSGGANSYHTPSGWPPDVDQWILVRSSGTLGSTTIQLTLDNFDTLLDRQGNLSTILGSWTNGLGNGFALPKVGNNADSPFVPPPPAIDVRVARATTSASAPSISISSADVEEGDMVMLHFRAFEDFAPTAVPSGFSLITNGEITGATGIRIYSKVATDSEPANYTFEFDDSSARVGLLAIYATEGGTIELDVSANQTNGGSETYTCPSVTTTVADTFLTCFVSTGNNRDPAAGAGMIKQYDLSAENGVHCMTQATLVGAIGATGTREMTDQSSTSKTVTAAWRIA